MKNKVSVFAPVSIGNVSVGFDSLGLALSPVDGSLLGDIISIEAAAADQFELSGDYADRLPDDKESNIVWSALKQFNNALKAQGRTVQPVAMKLAKNIPVCSGLGSSACSIVAAFAALNAFYQEPFNQDQLLRMMGQAEAQISGSLHYDNVAPCYLGSLQLMLNNSEQIAIGLPPLADKYWVLAYPDVVVSTQAARILLPAQYDRTTLIEFGQNLAGFVAACYRQDQDLALSLLKDVVAEPYRAELLPNFEATKQQLTQMHSRAVGISGSGPTLFSVCDDLETAREQAGWLNNHYLQSERGFVSICQTDTAGARTLL